MPMHDWTRVSAGTFHAFHNAWIAHLQEALNDCVVKIIASLHQGIHMVVFDAFPNGRHDPEGIHGLVWERLLAGD